MRKFLAIVLISGLCITGCDTGPDLVNCDFDETALLTNYADNIIIPRFEEFELSLLFLEGSVQAFFANPTPGLLVEIKISFGTSYLRYQECSPFAFGPGLINGVPFRERMNTFPTNTSNILQHISIGNSVENATKSEVGFPAIEYLLFGEEGTTDAEIVALFTTEPDAANRREYLSQLVAELKNTTTDMNTAWSSGYRNSFVGNLGTSTGSSLSLLMNDLNFDFETLKNFKFKIPLGKLNGGVVIPESVEGFYSNGSLELAQMQIAGMKDLFLGVGTDLADGPGLYEYLLCLKTENGDQFLADKISEQFDAISDALDVVPDPFSSALISDKPLVDNAYQQMQMMVPLLKYEMTTALGVQINYQDNDGD